MPDVDLVAVGPSFNATTGYVITPQCPTEAQGALVGHVAVAFIRDQTGSNTQDVTPPTGWNRFGGAFVASSGSYRSTSLWWKELTAADLGQTFQWSSQSNVTRKLGRIAVFKNVDVKNGSPILSQSGFLTGSAGTKTSNIAALANTANQFVVEVFVSEFTANNGSGLDAGTTVPLTLRSTDYRSQGSSQSPEDLTQSRSIMYVWAGKVGSSGLSAHAINTLGNQTVPLTQQFALKASSTATGTPTTPTAPPRRSHSARLWINQKVVIPRVRLSDGSIRTAQFIYLIPPRGYNSVTEMESKTEFWIGHRGGSAYFPEMSSRAYMESSMLGYGAMELSLAKTSDGVLFGMHDEWLDRTSLGVTGGQTLKASQMTWAQVQTYIIRGDRAYLASPAESDQPYMKFDDYLKYHQKRCVTFIDPKAIYDQATLTQILDIMDANGGPAKFVAKYAGVTGQGPTSWMGMARARGYKTWGFFYDNDTAANVTQYAPYYDYVGMNYNAADSYVQALKAAAQPTAKLIAHIIPDQAGVTSARAWTWKPSGFMISGTPPVAAANNVKVV